MSKDLGRIIIIGLDGCTLDVIKPWADMGMLPTFADLLSGGAWGTLNSTYPPITMPAWISFATGENPGRFGVYNFVTFIDRSYELRVNAYSRIPRHPELWSLLNANGLSFGIINNPLMDRPIKVDGFSVPGFMADELSYQTYPEHLRSELDEAVGKYELEVRGHYMMEEERLLAECMRVMNKRADAILHLLEANPVDVFLGIFTMTDRILHKLYNRYGPGRHSEETPPGNLMATFFSELDGRMKDIVEAVDDDDMLLIISDHGFSHKDRFFFVNKWLMDQGLLKWKGKGRLQRMGITQKGIGRVMLKLGLYEQAQRFAPSFLKRLIPPGHSGSAGTSVIDAIHEDRIDWANTTAVAIEAGPTVGIHFNTEDRPLGTVPAGKVGDLRQRIIHGISSMEDPATGSKLDVNIRLPQELYPNTDAPNAAEIYIDFGGDLIATGIIPEDAGLFGPASVAEHAMEGLFIARHPWVKRGRIDGYSLLDVMPTVLHLTGTSVPQAVDGRVMFDIFRPDSEPVCREELRADPRTVEGMLERGRIASVAKRLRDEITPRSKGKTG